MEDERIIQDVGKLLKYPDLRKALIHKVEELKSMLSKDLDQYMPFLGEESPGTSGGVGKEHIFVLKKVRKGVWIPSGPEITEHDAFDYVPPAIVRYIVKYPTKTGVIEMRPGVELKELPGRRFDLNFEKKNSSLIRGTIREHEVNPVETLFPDQRMYKCTFQNALENAARSEVIKILIYYLLRHDSYYKHVASQFYYRWKPLFDGKLIINKELPQSDFIEVQG